MTGRTVIFHDPRAESIHKKHEFMEFHQRESQGMDVDKDIIVILTALSAIREIKYKQFNFPTVDTRNSFPEGEEANHTEYRVY